MAEFKIPKGKPYEFTVRVLTKDSFLPQDLTNMSEATFSLIDIDTSCKYGEDIIGTVIGDNTLTNTTTDGVIKFSLTNDYTNGLNISRGDKVDGYYLKPTYQGIVTILFSDETEDRTTTIDKVYVTPTGCN